ncbi:hypothetical protein BD779DRAFT_842540 [Infundibulicybe gibba]|nr:hypothetical protein BD779DRAFT_842540 [Infundibulicybe gibba]
MWEMPLVMSRGSLVAVRLFTLEERRKGRPDHVNEPQSSVATPVTAGTANPAPSSSLLPTFQFANITDDATTCRSFTFLWSYSSPSVALLTLSVSTAEAVQKAAIPAVAPPTLRMLSTNLPSDTHVYTWIMVDVAEGWYQINARETSSVGMSPQSAPFFVRNGTNLECLKAAQTNTSTSTFHKPSNPPHHTPMRHLGTGELIGIVLGAVAGVLLLAIAFIFPRLWRRALPTTKKQRRYLFY